jgi:hypothetical protein
MAGHYYHEMIANFMMAIVDNDRLFGSLMMAIMPAIIDLPNAKSIMTIIKFK